MKITVLSNKKNTLSLGHLMRSVPLVWPVCRSVSHGKTKGIARRSFCLFKSMGFFWCVVLKAAAEFCFQKRILSFPPDLSHVESCMGIPMLLRKEGKFLVELFVRKCCLWQAAGMDALEYQGKIIFILILLSCFLFWHNISVNHIVIASTCMCIPTSPMHVVASLDNQTLSLCVGNQSGCLSVWIFAALPSLLIPAFACHGPSGSSSSGRPHCCL